MFLFSKYIIVRSIRLSRNYFDIVIYFEEYLKQKPIMI